MCYARATPDGSGYAINLSAKNFGFATEKNRAALHRILYLIFLSVHTPAAWRECIAAAHCRTAAARNKNATVRPLVTVVFGSKRSALTPFVMSFSTAHSTASRYLLSSAKCWRMANRLIQGVCGCHRHATGFSREMPANTSIGGRSLLKTRRSVQSVRYTR